MKSNGVDNQGPPAMQTDSPENERYTTPRTTSTNASESLTNRELYAAARAKLLFGGYRRGDANDPDIYVASIAAVLACYGEDIIREVTDPRSGISTVTDFGQLHKDFTAFMPNSGELKAYCDGIVNRRWRVDQYAALPPPRLRLPKPPAGPGD